MGLLETPVADRIHISIFGKINAGKSSLINAVTNQELSIVSSVEGTTTDPVLKSMELLPLGPVVLIDTPGLDDTGELGELRIEKAKSVLNKTDIALLVIDASGEKKEDKAVEDIKRLIEEKKIPCLTVYNKADLLSEEEQLQLKENLKEDELIVSCTLKEGIGQLKEKLGTIRQEQKKGYPIVSDLVEKGDTVILVVPIDESAPKGRLILPQQQTIRELLDAGAMAYVTKDTELAGTLESLKCPPKMVITDSQAFKKVSGIVPETIPLTSFSILFARHKGELELLVEGVSKLPSLKKGDKVLIAEGCTHHRQCGDIGTVKIPNWLKQYTGNEITYDTCSGNEFPKDLSPYAMVIHCGGCMLNEKEMKYRISQAGKQSVPIVNYGVFIAYVTGILKRSLSLFPLIEEKLKL